MRKINRAGEGHSPAPAGRKVNVSNSRRESQPGPRRGREPKEPKEPREKGRHPILRFIGRTIATLICLGIMAGSLVAVGAVYYVVQATANDGDLLDLDNIELSQSSTVVATDPDTGAQVEYATTAARIPDLERRIRMMENSISLLAGGYPGGEVRRSGLALNITMPDSLPVGLPSGLLQRRPDVRSSEQQLRAAMAEAGMAYADRFPRLTFTLTGGVENSELTGFFRSPFSYVAGAIAAPVFGFGRKQAKYRAALAAYDEARLAYEKKVLEVFKETDDAIVTYRNVRRTAELNVTLRDAASKYVKLANIQYRGGNINYIDVLDAQRRYLDAQIGLSNAVRDEHLALVQLYKALGGGWTMPDGGRK